MMNYWHGIYEILKIVVYITQVPVTVFMNMKLNVILYFLMYHLQEDGEKLC